jgi:fructose-1,6-bisphosphatase/inositol monophosphatase family enzyme
MTPTVDFMQQAEKVIREVLMDLQPQLIAAQGKIAHQLKADKTALTEMDIMVEDRLREALAQFDGSIGFGGEETGVDYSQKTFWLVDPIDGTEPFIRGLPFATNMIALIDNDQPVMGIVNNFSQNKYYLAIKGRGATCNGHPIHVSSRSLDRAMIILGGMRTEYAKLHEQLRDKANLIVKFAAAGAELVAIASGALEARISFDSNRGQPWDFAPGALIIQEAGGRVANIGSTTYDYRNNNVVLANSVVFDELMEFMNNMAAIAPK